jgi:hypothetical protein
LSYRETGGVIGDAASTASRDGLLERIRAPLPRDCRGLRYDAPE